MTKNILIMSDIHENWKEFNSIKLSNKYCEQIDLIIIAGDITNFGIVNEFGNFRTGMISSMNKWINELAKTFNCDVCFIPGNHDIGMNDIQYRIPYYDGIELTDYCIHNLLLSSYQFHSVKIVGMSLATAFDIPELAKTWANTTASRTHDLNYYESLRDIVNKGDIIVSHCPPYDCVDKTSQGAKIGSPRLLKLIEDTEPSLVICDHVHCQSGKEDFIGKTKVINTATKTKVIKIEV
jgi:uncharacterized protein